MCWLAAYLSAYKQWLRVPRCQTIDILSQEDEDTWGIDHFLDSSPFYFQAAHKSMSSGIHISHLQDEEVRLY